MKQTRMHNVTWLYGGDLCTLQKPEISQSPFLIFKFKANLKRRGRAPRTEKNPVIMATTKRP